MPLQSIMTDGELTLEAFRKQLSAGSRSRRGRTIDIESMADLGRLELFVDERRNKAAGQRPAAAAPRKGSTRAKTNWAKFRALVWADLGLPTWGSGGSEGAANGASRRHDAPGRSKCTAIGASQREDAPTQPSTAVVPAPEPKPKPRPQGAPIDYTAFLGNKLVSHRRPAKDHDEGDEGAGIGAPSSADGSCSSRGDHGAGRFWRRPPTVSKSKSSSSVDGSMRGGSSSSTSLVPYAPPPDLYNLPHTGTAVGPWMSTASPTYERLLGAAFNGDTLSTLANLLGLRRFHVFALVCTAWHDAVRAKMREWGVLTYVRSLGKGFGKRRGQFDTPTWLCMVPDGHWGQYLCVVDSCNYRLQVMHPGDGTVVRELGRPGASWGELSSPSSVACDPTSGKRIFTSTIFGAEDRCIMKFDLETWKLVQSTGDGEGRTFLDAPEGMAIGAGKLFVVDTASHRIIAYSTLTLEKVGQYPPVEWAAMRHGKAWDQLDNPMDAFVHEGELFVSDTHNDRIQVFNLDLEHIGMIGQRGKQAGQFIYPRGVAVAKSGAKPAMLYVAEQSRIQGLTLMGEPRCMVPIPGASNLCGLCVDGMRVYCTDMDSHTIHLLRRTHTENWREKRREAISEARAVRGSKTPRLGMPTHASLTTPRACTPAALRRSGAASWRRPRPPRRRKRSSSRRGPPRSGSAMPPSRPSSRAGPSSKCSASTRGWRARRR